MTDTTLTLDFAGRVAALHPATRDRGPMLHIELLTPEEEARAQAALDASVAVVDLSWRAAPGERG